MFGEPFSHPVLPHLSTFVDTVVVEILLQSIGLSILPASYVTNRVTAFGEIPVFDFFAVFLAILVVIYDTSLISGLIPFLPRADLYTINIVCLS